MKKNFFRVSVIIIFALLLVCMALTVQGNRAGMAGGTICPMVGWHTSSAGCGDPVASYQELAFQFVLRPGLTPNVGWNG
jgi:hypothetical protein